MVRKKEKDIKKKASTFFIVLSAICLILIALIFIGGVLKRNPQMEFLNQKGVLGEAIENSEGNESWFDFNIDELFENKVRETYDDAKIVASQKVVEVEKEVVEMVENEVKDMTKAQVDAIKLQICRDLGVISPEPEKKDRE